MYKPESQLGGTLVYHIPQAPRSAGAISGVLIAIAILLQTVSPDNSLITLNSVLLAGAVALMAWSVVTSRRTDKKIDMLYITMFGTPQEKGEGGMKGDLLRLETEIQGLRKARHDMSNQLQDSLNKMERHVHSALSRLKAPDD